MSSNSGDSSDSDNSYGVNLDSPWNVVDSLGLRQRPQITEFEREMKTKFTYDKQKYKEYSDLRLYSLQSTQRYYKLKNLLKFPHIPLYTSISMFSTQNILDTELSGFCREGFA